MFTSQPHPCLNDPCSSGRVAGLHSSCWQSRCVYMHLSNQVTGELSPVSSLNVMWTRTGFCIQGRGEEKPETPRQNSPGENQFSIRLFTGMHVQGQRLQTGKASGRLNKSFPLLNIWLFVKFRHFGALSSHGILSLLWLRNTHQKIKQKSKMCL